MRKVTVTLFVTNATTDEQATGAVQALLDQIPSAYGLVITPAVPAVYANVRHAKVEKVETVEIPTGDVVFASE